MAEELKDTGNTFIQLNNSQAFDPDNVLDMMATLSQMTEKEFKDRVDFEASMQQIRMTNMEKLSKYDKTKQEEIMQTTLRMQEALIDKKHEAERARLQEEYNTELSKIEELHGIEREYAEARLNEEYEKKLKQEDKLNEKRKKDAAAQIKREAKQKAEAEKKRRESEIEDNRNWATDLLSGKGLKGMKKIGIRTDENGNETRNAGTVMADIVGGLATLAKSLNNQIEEIASKKSAIDTRLQGSKGSTKGGSYWNAMENNIIKVAGISPFVKQSAVTERISSMVDQGIAFNIEQRAMLQELSGKIATTFDATNGTLLRLVRIQQQDTTAARLGMESALTSFLNNMYETTEYMRDLATSVKSNLEEAMSLMSGENALSFEYQVQKWMGSLYSVGMNSSSAQSLAGVIGQIAAGQLEGLTSGGASNLAVMAANRANLSIADMMAQGLDESSTNKLMQAMVEYLGDIYNETKGNKVLQQQYANVFGLKASDLKAVANLSSSVKNISTNGLNYNSAMNQLYNMAGSMYKRTSMGEMLTNMKSNAMYSMAGQIASSPVLYGLNEAANLLDTFAGGIQLPFINTFFGGVDLHTSVADIMRSGAMLGSIGTVLSKIAMGGSGGGISGTGILNSLGIKRGEGSFVTRGTGSGLATARGLSTSSSGTTVSNSSMDDVKGKSMSDASDSQNSQLAEASNDQDEVTIKDVDTHVLDIVNLLESVIHGSDAVRVVFDYDYSNPATIGRY